MSDEADMDGFSNSESGGEGSGGEPSEDDKAIELENEFYTATDEMEEGKNKAALASFRKCVKMEAECLKNKDVKEAKWTFKALQEIVALSLKLKLGADALAAYKQLLAYKGDDVNDNLLTRAISRVLDGVGQLGNADLEASFYEATETAGGGGGEGGGGGNKRIWFKTAMKKATGHLAAKRYKELKDSIVELENFVKDDGSKTDQLLDVYALEIQMYMEAGDKTGVKRTNEKAIQIVNTNPGTLTSKLPIFQYCGGKIMMEDGDFEQAYATLFDAFKYYQDIGSEIRIPCLKYMLIANMLKEVKKTEGDGDEKAEVQAKINPFDSKEVANMRAHPSIEPVAQLLDAYEKNNIRNVERILREHAKEVTDDPFLNQFIGRLLTKVRIAKILEMVKPYSRIHTQFLATQLTIEQEEVEDLLVRLILDNEIEGKINQVGHVLNLQGHADSASRYRAIERWSTQIGGVSRAITAGFFTA